MNRTSSLVKKTTKKFIKLQKYAFLEQHGFMSIDKLPYHSSFFYKFNFCFKEAVFHKHWKIPLKCKKHEMTQFFKRRALFPYKRRFLWRRVLWLGHALVFRSNSTKSPFCPTSETPKGRIQCNVWNRLLFVIIRPLLLDFKPLFFMPIYHFFYNLLVLLTSCTFEQIYKGTLLLAPSF